MKKISKSVYAAVSIYLFSCMPAQCYEDYSRYERREESIQTAGDGFYVIGRAEKKVKSDRAIFSMHLSVIGNSLEKVQKKLSAQLQELEEFLKKIGVNLVMTHTENLDIKVQDLEWGGHKKGHKYVISCPISAIINDVEKASHVQEKTMELIEKDFLFSHQRLAYIYTKIAELQNELTLKAIKNGQNMAQNYAQACDLRISAQPESIKSASLSAHPLTANPSPYSNTRYGESSDLENVFVVMVPMKYAITPLETSSNIPPNPQD